MPGISLKTTGFDSWETPPEIMARLHWEFGPFDLDPAATAENAKAPVFYTKEENGLVKQ